MDIQTHSTAVVAEWLRRWTRNPLGSARRGSNPLAVVAPAPVTFATRLDGVLSKFVQIG